MDFKLIHLPSVDSSNEYAKKHHQEIEKPFIVSTNTQTKGKGQFGKSFYSPKNKGIYMSLVLDFNINFERLKTLNIEIGNVLSDFINMKYDLRTRAVYPNDIYVDDKKLAGILTEGIFNMKTKTYDCIVIGIGLNLFKTEVPEDLKNHIITLDTITTKSIHKEKLIIEIAGCIYQTLKESS